MCLLFLASANVSSNQAFLTQDQNPFSLIHGQPQPVAARLPETGSGQWSVSLDITNTLNAEKNSTENLFVDFESYLLRFDYLYALNDDWAVKIDIPFIHYGGGFLDSTINKWHDFFGFPQAGRPNIENDQFQISYARNGQTMINLNTSDSGPGDIQLALSKQLVDDNDLALSLWTSIDLPTGSQAKFSSNDSVDFSLWLAADYRFHPEWSVDANIGVLFPGESNIENLRVEDQVFFTYAGIEWQVHPSVDLRIQLNSHTSFYSNSDLKLLGDAYNMVFGGRVHLDNCADLDLAFSEDVQVGATPDVSFFVSWKSYTNCQ